MCTNAVHETEDCVCGLETAPSCVHCTLLVFPDGEVFHERKCPNFDTKADNRDACPPRQKEASNG